LLVSQLKCELRVVNYNVSSNRVNEGFGKYDVSILKCSRLKTEKCRIQKCTYPTLLPAGDQDEVELVICLVWGILSHHLCHVICRRVLFAWILFCNEFAFLMEGLNELLFVGN